MGKLGYEFEEVDVNLPKIIIHTKVPRLNISSVVEVSSINDGLLFFIDPIESSVAKNAKQSYFHAHYAQNDIDHIRHIFRDIAGGSLTSVDIISGENCTKLEVSNIQNNNFDNSGTRISAYCESFEVSLISNTQSLEFVEPMAGAFFSLAVAATAIGTESSVVEGHVKSCGLDGGLTDASVTVASDCGSPITLPNNQNSDREPELLVRNSKPRIGYVVPGFSKIIK